MEAGNERTQSECVQVIWQDWEGERGEARVTDRQEVFRLMLGLIQTGATEIPRVPSFVFFFPFRFHMPF